MITSFMLLFIIMVVVFIALTIWLKLPIGLAMTASAVLISLLAGQGIHLNLLVEGMYAYLDVSIILMCAMIFMKAIEKNGLLNTMSKDLIVKFGRSPVALLTVMTIAIMFPGMITGSCTSAVLSTGALMTPLLLEMGMPRAKVGALIAMAAVYGMIAPPVNIMAMIIATGADMPYIGFELPLLLTTLPLAILTTIWYGYSYVKNADLASIRKTLENNCFTSEHKLIYLPLIVVIVLMIGPKAFPGHFPDLRLPLVFIIGTILALVTGAKLSFQETVKIVRQGVNDIMPVIGLLLSIGLLIEMMTFTGIRGWLVVSSVNIPTSLLLISIAVFLPLFGSISVFGAASVLGVPYLFALLDHNQIITACALTVVAGMGSFTPPVALTAVIASQVVGESNYLKIVRLCIIPALVAIAVGILMIIYADQIAKILPIGG